MALYRIPSPDERNHRRKRIVMFCWSFSWRDGMFMTQKSIESYDKHSKLLENINDCSKKGETYHQNDVSRRFEKWWAI